MKKRADYKFRWQPIADNPDFALIQYLKNHWTTPKEAILQTIRAFWLPIACQHDPQYSPEQIKRMGRESLALLEEQSNYLRQELDLEDPSDSESKIYRILSRFQETAAINSEEAEQLSSNGLIYSNEDIF